MWKRNSLGGVLWLAFASLLQGQPGAPVQQGYLGAISPSLISVVPPAPDAGDARDTTDRAIFRATRTTAETPRWVMAQHDADYSVTGLLNAFACSLGVVPNSGNAPRLAALLARASMDTNAANAVLKNQYRRKRPFLRDSGPICVPRDQLLVNSYDYPSGHSMLGWMTGLILAELEPDHAVTILARARAYGESRVFCGVHTASAVEAGRVAAAAVVAELHGSPEFRQDQEAAKKELAELRQQHQTALQSCASESRLVSSSPYSLTPPPR